VLTQYTARELVKRFAERVAPVAQTTHPTQAGLARVLNSLVVAVMITTPELLAPFVATPFISRDNYPTNLCYSP